MQTCVAFADGLVATGESWGKGRLGNVAGAVRLGGEVDDASKDARTQLASVVQDVPAHSPPGGAEEWWRVELFRSSEGCCSYPLGPLRCEVPGEGEAPRKGAATF